MSLGEDFTKEKTINTSEHTARVNKMLTERDGQIDFFASFTWTFRLLQLLGLREDKRTVYRYCMLALLYASAACAVLNSSTFLFGALREPAPLHIVAYFIAIAVEMLPW